MIANKIVMRIIQRHQTDFRAMFHKIANNFMVYQWHMQIVSAVIKKSKKACNNVRQTRINSCFGFGVKATFYTCKKCKI